jgi:hypothetical protein
MILHTATRGSRSHSIADGRLRFFSMIGSFAFTAIQGDSTHLHRPPRGAGARIQRYGTTCRICAAASMLTEEEIVK